ncbi:MAG: hypothetical protein L0206_16835 [Actinobacteria bacterium]|nr:hypothetical protein [Actinomycetota bacterium]
MPDPTATDEPDLPTVSSPPTVPEVITLLRLMCDHLPPDSPFVVTVAEFRGLLDYVVEYVEATAP